MTLMMKWLAEAMDAAAKIDSDETLGPLVDSGSSGDVLFCASLMFAFLQDFFGDKSLSLHGEQLDRFLFIMAHTELALTNAFGGSAELQAWLDEVIRHNPPQPSD